MDRRAELLKGVALGAAAISAPIFLRLAPEWAARFYPVCILYKFTGLCCPGCGTLRALESLGRFDIAAAFLYNPFLLTMIIPLFLYLCVIYITRGVTGRWIPSLLSSPKAALPALVVIAAVWVLRNLFPPAGLGAP